LRDNVPPERPQDLSVVADELEDDLLLLSWSAPARDEDGDILTGLAGYLVLRSEVGTTSFATVATVGGDALEYEDNDLKLLTLYSYTVVAFDEKDNRSSQSVAVQARTGGVVVPGGLLARGEIGRIVLTWFDSAEEDLLGYNLYRSTRSDSVYDRLGAEGSAFTTGQTTYIDSNLVADAEFFYKVSAVTTQGESDSSGFVGAKVLLDEVAPGAPQNVLVVTDSSSIERLTVSWSAPVEDADRGELTGLAGYVILRSEGGNTSFVELTRVGSGVLSYEDNGLKPLTVYVYGVVAFDAAGNESAQAVGREARTSGVAVPGGLLARGEIGRIVVSWFDSAEEGLLGYNLYRSTRSDSVYDRLEAEGSAFTTGQTSYIDSNLATDAEFFYKVSAVIVGGAQSERSVFVGATVLPDIVAPGAPQNVLAVRDAAATDRLTVSWSAPIEDADRGD